MYSSRKDEKRIAVIIPSYNGGQLIVNCINSLKKQKYNNYEIIVVDNASEENNVKLLRSIKGLNLIENKRNRGFSKACNQGIRIAKKENLWAVVLLNQDTVVERNFLGEGVKVLSTALIGLACPKIIYGFSNKIWWAGGKLNRGYKLLTSLTFRLGEHVSKGVIDKGQFNTPTESDYITGCALFIRVELVNKVGLLDERYFMYSEDIDWSLRVKKAGYNLIYFPTTTVHHMVKKGTRGSFKSKFKKAYIYFSSAAKCVYKNYSLAEKILWTLKLPIVLPIEFRNIRNME